MIIRAPKDFWSGLMFLAFAATALITASGYSLGRGGRMGPGYFPILLGIVLAVLGLILVVRSFIIEGEGLQEIKPWPLAVLTIAVIVFGLLIERFGLVVSLMTVTMIAAYAGRDTRPLEAIMLSVVLTLVSVGIFVLALGLPLSIWPQF